MIVSRTAAENALLNKHEIKRLMADGKLIKGFPLVDSNNPQHIEEIAGNELRVLKRYPAAFDFLVNFINDIWYYGEPQRSFRRVDTQWWKTRITEKTWKKYFSFFSDFSIRQSLARQVLKELETGFITITGRSKDHGRFIYKTPPFRIMGQIQYEDGTGYRDIFLNDTVFGSLITMDCKKTGSDGFVELPPNLYPLLTGPDTGELKSYNPVYRLNLFGVMKNTHRKSKIEIDRQTFVETVAPEYLDKDGYLEVSPSALQNSLHQNIHEALPKIQQGLVVKNIYVGNPGGNSTIYFRMDN